MFSHEPAQILTAGVMARDAIFPSFSAQFHFPITFIENENFLRVNKRVLVLLILGL